MMPQPLSPSGYLAIGPLIPQLVFKHQLWRTVERVAGVTAQQPKGARLRRHWTGSLLRKSLLLVSAVVALAGSAALQNIRELEPSETPEVVPTNTVPSGSPSPSVPQDVEATADPLAISSTVSRAVAAVTAFCNPALAHDVWIDDLLPYLSQAAAVAYETVDPSNVPCTAVTGEAGVRDGDASFTMRVLVPTDSGAYSVYMHRTAPTQPWLVEQIVPFGTE